MTTSAVSQLNLFGTAQTGTASVKNDNSDSFSQIFASQSETKTESKLSEQSVKTEKTQTTQKTDESFQQEDVKETQEVTDTQESEDVTNEQTKDITEDNTTEVLSEEEMEEAVAQLLTAVQEVMNVSPQDIQDALKELGLTAEDLLDTKNIAKLVVALTEGADELSVMTNENVFANVQEITAKAEEILTNISETTGMSFEDIQVAIAKMSEIDVEEPVVMTQAVPNETVTTEEMTVSLENSQLEQLQTAETDRTTDSRQSMENGNSQQNAGDSQMTFAQTVATQLEQAVAKTDAVASSYTTTTESIMNQIQDTIRVMQTQDMTEMELQLHPASLGNLRVQIAAKEGVITATFTTENETVRAALEAQLITLKENFEQQGVKVEAVEVTVASHAFEQNLNGDESHAGEQAEPEKKRGARRISLSELTTEDLEEELSDEDRIVAELMKENGNTVDYTV